VSKFTLVQRTGSHGGPGREIEHHGTDQSTLDGREMYAREGK
jgi:hypothetical protein